MVLRCYYGAVAAPAAAATAPAASGAPSVKVWCYGGMMQSCERRKDARRCISLSLAASVMLCGCGVRMLRCYHDSPPASVALRLPLSLALGRPRKALWADALCRADALMAFGCCRQSPQQSVWRRKERYRALVPVSPESPVARWSGPVSRFTFLERDSWREYGKQFTVIKDRALEM